MKMLDCSLFQAHKLGVRPTYKVMVIRWGRVLCVLRTCKECVNSTYFIVSDAAHCNVRSKTSCHRDPEEGITHVPILIRHVFLKLCRTLIDGQLSTRFIGIFLTKSLRETHQSDHQKYFPRFCSQLLIHVHFQSWAVTTWTLGICIPISSWRGKRH